MVDIETTGLRPDRHGIIQIAAVKFNYNTEEISSDVFDEAMTLPPTRSWDMGTAHWWSTQNKRIFDSIINRSRNHLEVMNEFFEWCKPFVSNPGENGLKFWGKPTHFDYCFMDSYFKDFNIPWPFHFREARDMNSFMAGLSKNPKTVDTSDVTFHGDAHNAVFDTLNQLKILFYTKHRYVHG